jgi:hypothetical protein
MPKKKDNELAIYGGIRELRSAIYLCNKIIDAHNGKDVYKETIFADAKDLIVSANDAILLLESMNARQREEHG